MSSTVDFCIRCGLSTKLFESGDRNGFPLKQGLQEASLGMSINGGFNIDYDYLILKRLELLLKKK